MRWGAGVWLIRLVLKTSVCRKVDREFESHPHRRCLVKYAVGRGARVVESAVLEKR